MSFTAHSQPSLGSFISRPDLNRHWTRTSKDPNSKNNWLTRTLTLITFCLFLATPFRSGWQRAETDFPNYDTAAVLLRKGESLRNYYDWTWFGRQMNYAGIEKQLGGYTPQTPLTMTPMVGLAKLPVQ